MGSITINGKSYQGNNISVQDGVVYVDGKNVDDAPGRIIKVEITGDVSLLRCDAPVTLTGNINGDAYVTGPVKCNNIGGSIKVTGPVHCGDIKGDAHVQGPVMRR